MSIQSQIHGLGGAGDTELDTAFVVDDDGPIAQRVRADWRDDERFDVGMDDGPAGGKGISSRASGSRDDKAVGTITTNEIGVDSEAHFDHAGERAFIDNDFVEDALIVDRFAVANQGGVEHHAFAGSEVSRECFFKGGIELLQRETREKTEAAEVDGQNWNAAGSGFASCR